MHSSGKAHAKKVAIQEALGNTDTAEKRDGDEHTNIVNIVRTTPGYNANVKVPSAGFRLVKQLNI